MLNCQFEVKLKLSITDEICTINTYHYVLQDNGKRKVQEEASSEHCESNEANPTNLEPEE